VLIVPIPDVGDAGEARGERLTYRLFADEPGTPRFRSPRPFENGVVGEVDHDPVEVVLIEGPRDGLEHQHRVGVVNDSSSLACFS